MPWLTRLRRYLRDAVRGRRMAREIDEELRFHIETLVDELVARGASPAEARRIAARRFGRLDLMRDEARYAKGVGLADDLWQDLRFAVRRLRHQPGFAVTVVLTFQLYHVSPHDPVTIAVVLFCFVLVALVAAYGPARRATRVDPIAALRCE
jgi:hypothetical protein